MLIHITQHQKDITGHISLFYNIKLDILLVSAFISIQTIKIKL